MTELLDIHETARYLTVSERTVHRLVKDGKLTKQKIRGSTRFRRSEVDRYLRAPEVTGSSPVGHPTITAI